jgi:hypothetical protein
VRDYNDGVFNNVISAPTANWFNNGGPADGTGSQQRLDQQTYDLSSLTGHLIEVDVTSNPVCIFNPATQTCDPAGSAGGEDTIFAGLTFLTESSASVPEPGTLMLLFLGLGGLAAIGRRKLA